jgi:hypothetical protein
VEAVAAIDSQMLQRVWQELDYRIDICRVTKGEHIEHLKGRRETWSVSPSVDMLPFGVTIQVTVPQRSKIPEGLTNYPVYELSCIYLVVAWNLNAFQGFKKICNQSVKSVLITRRNKRQ